MMMQSVRFISRSSSRLARLGASIRPLSSSSCLHQEPAKVPPMLWKLGNLNHVAIATPDLEKSTALYRDILGAEVSDVEALPEHGVYTVFVKLDNTKLELLYPLGDNSPIQEKSQVEQIPPGHLLVADRGGRVLAGFFNNED